MVHLIFRQVSEAGNHPFLALIVEETLDYLFRSVDLIFDI